MGRRHVAFKRPSGTCFWMGEDPSSLVGCLGVVCFGVGFGGGGTEVVCILLSLRILVLRGGI